MRRNRRLDRTPPASRVEVVRARVTPRVSPVRVPRFDLRLVEDRRVFHPEGRLRPALTFSRRDQRRIVIKTKHVSEQVANPFLSPRVGFLVPERVAICVRRKQRREVIHAKGLVRKGSGAARRGRTAFSDVDCR